MGQLPLQIEGIQETLKLLNDIDPKFRRRVTIQIRNAGASILSEARQMVASFDNSKGNGAPLSGMVRGNLVSKVITKKIGVTDGRPTVAVIGGSELPAYDLTITLQTQASA